MPSLSQNRLTHSYIEENGFGKPNKPSTPIRDLINSSFGSAAEIKYEKRTQNATMTKLAERMYRPSRGHTRATTLYCEQIKNVIDSKKDG